MKELKNRCSRDTRRVLTLLSSICEQKGVEFDDSPTQGYMGDMLMMMFYPTPMLSILKTSMNKIKNFQTKHGTVEYWIPMLINMMGGSLKSAIRTDAQTPDWEENPIVQIPINRYDYITSRYLLIDYGYEEMMMIHKMINTIDDKMIEYACGVGRQNNVFDTRYIKVVIEKEIAKNAYTQQRKQNVWDNANTVVEESIHSHSFLDMMEVEYKWQKANENAELEKMWRDKFEKI